MTCTLYSSNLNHIADPLNPAWGKAVTYVKAAKLPEELMNWTAINPRGQNMEKDRVQVIGRSLEENRHFHLLNRGVSMNVEAYRFDAREGALEIDLTDQAVHGILDGAHSVRTALEAENIKEDRYIQVELFTLPGEMITSLGVARNWTVEVDLRSLANLEGELDYLKELFRPLPFSDRIFYKANDPGKDIDVQDLLSVVLTFCDDVFPLSDGSRIKFVAPKNALKRYLYLSSEERKRQLGRMAPILPDIFALWDLIELEFVQRMPRSKHGKLLKKSLDYIGHGRGKSKVKERDGVFSTFSRTPTPYWVSKEVIRPLLAAFTALVEIGKDGAYHWRYDPFLIWAAHGGHLVGLMVDADRSLINGDKLDTRSVTLWDSLYSYFLPIK